MADPLTKEIQLLNERVAQLSPKRLYKLMRSVVRNEMRRVARKVANQAIASGLNVDPKEFRHAGHSVRGNVRRDMTAGFVTLKPHPRYKVAAMYNTRHGKRSKDGTRYKPIAYWAADGTRDRKTRGKGLRRGAMPAYNFFNNGDALMAEADKRIGAAFERRVKAIIAGDVKRYLLNSLR